MSAWRGEGGIGLEGGECCYKFEAGGGGGGEGCFLQKDHWQGAIIERARGALSAIAVRLPLRDRPVDPSRSSQSVPRPSNTATDSKRWQPLTPNTGTDSLHIRLDHHR